MSSQFARRVKLAAILFAAVLFCGTMPLRAAEVSKEYQVKAVFLFNFAEFVQWPTNTFSNAQAPLVIGILGDDPFGSYLDETIRGEKIDGHPLIIQHFRSVKDVTGCHLLFISRSEKKNLSSILDQLKGRKILTVGDVDNFPEDGGVIGFMTIQNKIHFTVNLGAAKSAGLTISSKMLRLAKVIGAPNE